MFAFSTRLSVHPRLRQWHDEQETHLGQGAGSAGPPGMAVQEEGEQRLPGHQVEEVLVRAEEDVALLVHQPAGQITNRQSFCPLFRGARVSLCGCVPLELLLTVRAACPRANHVHLPKYYCCTSLCLQALTTHYRPKLAFFIVIYLGFFLQ